MNRKRGKGATRQELADRLGVSTAAVCRAIKEGRITTLDDDTLDIEACAAQWAANTHPGKRGPAPKRRLNRNADVSQVRETAAELGIDDGNALSYNDAATLLKNCQARLAEIELNEKQGRSIDVDDMRKEAFKLARLTRDAMLAIPDRLAAEIAGLTDPFEVHAKMMAEIRNAIAEVAKGAEG